VPKYGKFVYRCKTHSGDIQPAIIPCCVLLCSSCCFPSVRALSLCFLVRRPLLLLTSVACVSLRVVFTTARANARPLPPLAPQPSVLLPVMQRALLLLDSAAGNVRRRDKIIQLVDRLCMSRAARAALERLRSDDTTLARLASSRFIPHRLLFACRSYVPPAGEPAAEGAGGGAPDGGEGGGGVVASAAGGGGDELSNGAGGPAVAVLHGAHGAHGTSAGEGVDTGGHRQCRVRVVASDERILSSSLATVGKLHPYHLLRGGGLSIELLDPPSPPSGPSVVGGFGSTRAGVAVVEDDWEVMARWFSLIAQALPRAEAEGRAGRDAAAAAPEGLCDGGDGGGEASRKHAAQSSAHFSSPACARFFGRLIAMAILWDECDGAGLAPSCWEPLWAGLHAAAQQDAARLEASLSCSRPDHGRAGCGLLSSSREWGGAGDAGAPPMAGDEASQALGAQAQCCDGVIAQVLLQAIELCAPSAICPEARSRMYARQCVSLAGPTAGLQADQRALIRGTRWQVYAGLVELLPAHLLVLLRPCDLRDAVLEGSWKSSVVTSFSKVD